VARGGLGGSPHPPQSLDFGEAGGSESQIPLPVPDCSRKIYSGLIFSPDVRIGLYFPAFASLDRHPPKLRDAEAAEFGVFRRDAIDHIRIIALADHLSLPPVERRKKTIRKLLA
jgi:hypothetical protein